MICDNCEIAILIISCDDIARKWLPRDIIGNKSTWFQDNDLVPSSYIQLHEPMLMEFYDEVVRPQGTMI